MTGKKYYSVFYCSQLYRHKKVKSWLDGFLEQDGSKAILYDERHSRLETLLHKAPLDEGDELDFDRYFCTIDACVSNSTTGGTPRADQQENPGTPIQAPSTPAPRPSVRKPFRLTVTPKTTELHERAMRMEEEEEDGLDDRSDDDGGDEDEGIGPPSPDITSRPTSPPPSRQPVARAFPDLRIPLQQDLNAGNLPTRGVRSAEELLAAFASDDDEDGRDIGQSMPSIPDLGRGESNGGEAFSRDPSHSVPFKRRIELDAVTQGGLADVAGATPAKRARLQKDLVNAGRLSVPTPPSVGGRSAQELLAMFGSDDDEDTQDVGHSFGGSPEFRPEGAGTAFQNLPATIASTRPSELAAHGGPAKGIGAAAKPAHLPLPQRPSMQPQWPRFAGSIVYTEGSCTAMLNPLSFPNQKACENVVVERHVKIPTQFDSATKYKEAFCKAIVESLQVQLAAMASSYHKLRADKQNSNLTTAFFRGRDVPYYADCVLSNHKFVSRKKGPKRLSLLLHEKEHHSKYSKDDIWAISASPDFAEPVLLAHSQFYGPSKNAVELCPISDPQLAARMIRDTSKKSVWAIRAASASSEILMMGNLGNNLDKTPSLIPWILAPPVSKTPSKTKGRRFQVPLGTPLVVNAKMQEYFAIMEATADRFTLNPNQREVFKAFAESVAVPSHSPITLCHGVFGAGKSYLVAVIVMFLHQAKEKQCFRNPDEFKVMVASMTNVAVDRILLELVSHDYNDFVRVGSMKKIAKPILPFTARALYEDEADLKDLQDMLNSELSQADRGFVQQAIDTPNEVKPDVSRPFLVGATCLATTFESFDFYKNSIVILDECSQMTEPMSLLPMLRFGAKKALLIGDPLQLAPTITSPAAHRNGLELTLFERLAALGIDPILLRTQYRCHPRIAAISNQMFYNRELTNAKTEAQLAPLIDGLPTLCFVDVEGVESRKGATTVNAEESKLIVNATRSLLNRSVIAPEDVGVISLYKGQAELMHDHLSHHKSVQVSTCDAFQGAEKTVIFLSTVRTRNLGFADEARRVNVALTRAKRHLVIFGNRKLLATNKLWGRIIADHCKEDVCLTPRRLLDVIENGRLLDVTVDVAD